MMATGYDCVMIPGASKFVEKVQVPNSICGQKFVTAEGVDNKTICSKTIYLFIVIKMKMFN